MDLINQLQQSAEELHSGSYGLSDAQLLFKPSEKSWSVMECLEHLMLINLRVEKIIITIAPSESIENTKSELFSAEKLNHLLVIKRDVAKVDAPDFSVPKGHFKNINEISENINTITTALVNYVSNNDIAKETHTIKHLRLGEMTKTDWLNFMIAHNKRHLIQIAEVRALQGL